MRHRSEVVEYRVEGGPPNALYRQGWRKDTLKAGDVVTVSGIRAKRADSMNIGVATITTADGKRIFANGGRQAEQTGSGAVFDCDGNSRMVLTLSPAMRIQVTPVSSPGADSAIAPSGFARETTS